MAPSKNTEREAREGRDRLRRYTARQSVHSHDVHRRKRDNLFAVGAVVVIAALATVTQVFYFTGGPGTPTPLPSSSQEPQAGQNVGDIPNPSIAEARTWTGELALNDVTLGITLDGAKAPQGVASFVTSARAGYFDAKTCHRLVRTETAGLIQCGSIDGAGASDPAYSFGPIENAAPDGIYPAGTIALARSGDNAYSQGHQFFIVFKDAQLPADSVGGYTIIGSVTSGLDQLISQIADGGIVPGVGGVSDGSPIVPTAITRLTIQ